MEGFKIMARARGVGKEHVESPKIKPYCLSEKNTSQFLSVSSEAC